jgi:hypothetical protein
MADEPVAWAAVFDGEVDAEFVWPSPADANAWAAARPGVEIAPLYRHPQQPALSEAEWDALYKGAAVLLWEGHTREEGSEGSRNLLQIAAALKGLRERLEGRRE